MNDKKLCPQCGHIISEREIGLYKGMIISLLRIFLWCEQNNRHEFTRKDIKHLLKSDNEIARFGDLVMFGGLVYKPEGKGSWGINMERMREFVAGKYTIPMKIWKNPVDGHLTPEDYRSIDDIPSLSEFLDENGSYIAKYREPQRRLL